MFWLIYWGSYALIAPRLHQEANNISKNTALPDAFLDFCPLKRYNLPTHAPVAQWIERLTSNCAGKVNTLSMGENIVHPLDGIIQILSIKSTKSIPSTQIAPELHPERPTKSSGLAIR